MQRYKIILTFARDYVIFLFLYCQMLAVVRTIIVDSAEIIDIDRCIDVIMDSIFLMLLELFKHFGISTPTEIFLMYAIDLSVTFDAQTA